MNEILEIIEKNDIATEKISGKKLKVKVEIDKIRGDEFYEICRQENLNVEKQESVLGNIYYTEWLVNENLTVLLTTDYLPRRKY